MAQSTLWEKVKSGGKVGFDKTWKAMDKLGAPVNKLSNKLGSEAFWPTTLDKESDKAARILKSFCKDGFYAEEETTVTDGPKQKQKVLKKIPTDVIKKAKGLAIFTTMRSGLWISGAGGSGVLLARKEDGTWSPPSGILLHTAGLGFLIGIDIYDCVIVINSTQALEAFTKLRCTLGSEISVAAGPVGAGGILDTELHKRQAPIFTYLKSRGFYAGVQIDGTVVIERTDENERFYGQKIPVKEILAGNVRHPPYEVRRLLETVRAAQGDGDIDESILPTEAPPGDYEIDDGHVFGVPDKQDPDPYGVLALEKEGMSIKEAGTQKRASWETFSFNPAPTSPVHNMKPRNSGERPRSVSTRSSWRASALGNTNDTKPPSSLRDSMDVPASPIVMSDMATQTEPSPDRSPDRRSQNSRHSSRASLMGASPTVMQGVPEHSVLDSSTTPSRGPDETGDKSTQINGYSTPPKTPPLSADHTPENHDHERDEEDAQIEEPIVHSVQTVQPASPQVVSKARIVNVPKRGPPPRLPPRNPNRAAGPVVIGASPVEDAGTQAQEKGENEVDRDEAAGHESSMLEQEKDAISPLEEKVEDVKLEDEEKEKEDENVVEKEEDDEAEKRDPWAKVEETRNREATAMPGGFE